MKIFVVVAFTVFSFITACKNNQQQNVPLK